MNYSIIIMSLLLLAACTPITIDLEQECIPKEQCLYNPESDLIMCVTTYSGNNTEIIETLGGEVIS